MRGEVGIWEDTNISITSDKTNPQNFGGFHIESEALGCLCVGVYMFEDNIINNVGGEGKFMLSTDQ